MDFGFIAVASYINLIYIALRYFIFTLGCLYVERMPVTGGDDKSLSKAIAKTAKEFKVRIPFI